MIYLHPESIVGKDDYRWPPLCWKDFIPYRSGGLGFRYHLIEREPVKIQAITQGLLSSLRKESDLMALSVDDFLVWLESGKRW